MTIADAFDRAATAYDRERAALVPQLDLFYGAAVALLPFSPDAPARMLDLGAGTGLLTRIIGTAFPKARLTLVDVAPQMLEEARVQFARMGREAEFRLADYADAPLGGPYEAVVSALSIHHLEHEAKRGLFARVQEALAPGGVFVNAEQVLGPTRMLEASYDAAWEAHAQAAGAGAEAIAAARRRMETYDRCATVSAQLVWMSEAGFQNVDCWWKNGRFAVLTGRRTGDDQRTSTTGAA